MTRELELERLQKIFSERRGGTGDPDRPDPETLWRAVAGELPTAELERLTDRMAEDPELAAEWRIALDLYRAQDAGSLSEMPRVEGAPPTPLRPQPRARRFLLAAAVVAAAVGGVFVYRAQDPQPAQTIFRGSEHTSLRSLVGAQLPRDQFVLEWTPGPEGTVYQLVVSDSDLRVLLTLKKLYEPKALVPGADLESLPPGASVRWQVVATDPEGGQQRSPTFETRIR